MWLLSWILLSSIITSALAIPATIQNNIATGAQPDISSLAQADVIDPETHSPLAARPVAPYSYRLRKNKDFQIRFESYAAEIASKDGGILL